MKISTNANSFLLLLLLFVISVFHHSHALTDVNRDLSNEVEMDSELYDDVLSVDENELIKRSLPKLMQPTLNDRRSDSAEKYFHWASKTNRPMEYWRGKRFWLFTKNDEQVRHYGAMPNPNGASPGSFSQGIWRSGIVGRRRR